MESECGIHDTHDHKDKKCAQYAIIFPIGREFEFSTPDSVYEKRSKDKNYYGHLFFTAKTAGHSYCCNDRKSRFSIFKIIEDRDKEEEREEEHKDVMAKKSGEVYHIRRKCKKESSEEGLFFINIANTVDAIYKRNQECSKK
jgi:hypothetical protein